MKVLVACHCKESHSESNGITLSPTLNFTNKLTKQFNPSDTEIHYIDQDPNCPSYGKEYQYYDWSEVPNNYFDLIWYEHCPIGPLEEDKHTREIFLSLVTDSLEKLKTNGLIMTQTYTSEEFIKGILQKAGIIYKYNIETSVVLFKDIPYWLFRKGDQRSVDNGNVYMIIKKLNKGGRKRTNKKRKQTNKRRRYKQKKTNKRKYN